MAHNLGVKVLNQRYGILVPVTYKHICPTASRDDMNQAHILGWCVELGMFSHKMSLITIFGHKHFKQKFHQKFDIFQEKISTAFDFGSYLE